MAYAVRNNYVNSFFLHYIRFKHVKVSTAKYHMVQYKQKICTVSGTQAGRHEETLKRVDIHKSDSVACGRALGAGQTVCDTGCRTQRHKKEPTLIIVEDNL